MVRHKNRYFVVRIREIEAPEDAPLHLHPANVYGAITGAVQHLHGDFGVAVIKTGFVAKYCNAQTKIAIIRCRHGPHEIVASSMPFVKNIGPVRANIITLFTGATMKHCFLFIKRYQQKKLEEYCAKMKTEEQKAELKKMMLNMDTVLSIL